MNRQKFMREYYRWAVGLNAAMFILELIYGLYDVALLTGVVAAYCMLEYRRHG